MSRYFVLRLFVLTHFFTSPSLADDQTDFALKALEFGSSTGQLLWTTVSPPKTRPDTPVHYTQLADTLKQRLAAGRAVSELVKANFDFASASLLYGAASDPEPFSKAVAATAAFGIKKAGDVLNSQVIETSQNQTRAILAQGLKNSNLSPNELRRMTPDQLQQRVSDLRIGSQKIAEILKDQPDALNMLQAHAFDIATNIGVEALARASGTAADATKVRSDLASIRSKLNQFQETIADRMAGFETRLTEMSANASQSAAGMKALSNMVQSNTKAVQNLALVSFAGWSTSQKLQAVRSGVIGGLTDEQRVTLTQSLESDQRRERIVSDLSSLSADFGNLATIAKNIGLPPDAVQTMQGAQIIATGIQQAVTGNYIGMVASLTGLGGLGGTDAATERHAATMKYLAQQFEAINKRLEAIIDLQVKTLNALADLAKSQQEFRAEVLSQLNRVEDTVLRSERMLQALLLSKWSECFSLINGTELNGQFVVYNQEMLRKILSHPNLPQYASICYSTMTTFFDAYVKSAQWSGQVIAANNFPSDAIADNTDLQRDWVAYQQKQAAAYEAARDFVLAILTDAPQFPAQYLLRFAEPMATEPQSSSVRSSIQTNLEALRGFRCNQIGILSRPIVDLLCFGLPEGSANAPLQSRWSALVASPLIGPHAVRLLDTGMTLAMLSDLALRAENASFEFIAPGTIASYVRVGPSDLMVKALAQKKGNALLSKLQWLSEAYIFQLGVASGDYTSQLIEMALYDTATRSLSSQKRGRVEMLAINAMRQNSLLARNVVLLAMRHAIQDALGGIDPASKARYRQADYHLALAEHSDLGCQNIDRAQARLRALLPNWQLEYRRKRSDTDSKYQNCPVAEELTGEAGRGSGVSIKIDDFYVELPSPASLYLGHFEVSEALRRALRYRDRLNQARADKDFAPVLMSQNLRTASAKVIAFELLNKGFAYRHVNPK